MNTEYYRQMSHQDWLDHQAEIQRLGAVIVDRQARLSRIEKIKKQFFSKSKPKNKFKETHAKTMNLEALAHAAKLKTLGLLEGCA